MVEMNKYFPATILVTIGVWLISLSSFSQTTRQELLFNDGWKFHYGEVSDAMSATYNDNEWQATQLPHDWSIEQPFSDQWASATGFLPGGIGWYRKAFTVPASWKGKIVSINFDGVYNNSEVWINGHYLGKRPNGFVPFEYELTKYLNIGSKNLIAVKANHTKFADSRWYTGSGIYRDVHLIVAQPVHIAQWGVAFTTPQVTKEMAKAKVQIAVANEKRVAGNVIVQIQLTEKNGKAVATAKQSIQLNKQNANANIDLEINKPMLWSIDDPALYTLQVEIFFNGKKTDEYKEQVGIRSIRFDANNGFFLNEKNIKLKGVCVHDDAGVLGVAVPEEVWVRRLQELKEVGCNSLRMSHNPHAAYLYKLCDEMGLVVMDEAFDEWETGKNKWIKGWNKGDPGKDGYHEYFNEWAERDIDAMIMRNRNHPSIIMWSIGNEIDYPNDPYSHEVLNSGRNPQIYGKGYLPDHPPASRLGELSARLVKEVKSLDTTRPVTAALAGVVMSNTTSYPSNLDIVGYNYQEYRYPEDHAAYPSRVIYGSENGMAPAAWNAVDSNQYISAQYLWTGIDYMGEAGAWPTHGSGAGLLNLGGFRKPGYYIRQAMWSDKPVVYIATSQHAKANEGRGFRGLSTEWQKGSGDTVAVHCFSNCSETELFVNGKSLGRQSVSTPYGNVNWNVPYTSGELKVVGYNQGKEASSYVLHSTGAPQKIKATVYEHPLAHKTSIKQIIVDVTDANGYALYKPGNEVTVAINGKATLLGIENSNLSDTSNYKANHKAVTNGSLIVYVRAPADGDAFSVSITSPGLTPATISFDKAKNYLTK